PRGEKEEEVALPYELVVAGEAVRGLAAGGGAVAEPVGQLFHRLGEGAAGAVGPGQAIGGIESLQVRNAAILVALQADALAAAHFGQLVEREHQQLAILPDDSDAVAIDRH